MVLLNLLHGMSDWPLARWTLDLIFVLTIGFILGNLKALPGMWHVRILRFLQSDIIFNRSRVITAANNGGQALFKSVVMVSHSPLLEIDYNMHKSNSTFFSDLDISRTNLIVKLFKPALSVASLGGKLDIALGATACTFKKAIMPYEKYEIWSRVLAWDEKWLYVVSHFVRKGTSKKLQNLRNNADSETLKVLHDKELEFLKAIYASAITKYVFKDRRVTVRPDQILKQLHLLPEAAPIVTLNSTKEAMEVLSDCKTLNSDFHINKGASDLSWDAVHVELQRQKGLTLAKSLIALDDLHGSLLTGGY